MRQMVFMGCLAAIPALSAVWLHPRRPSWVSDEVRLTEVREWADRVIWLDARPAKDYEEEHIPGALLLNEESWDENLGPILDLWEPKKKVLVVYCSTLSCQTSHEVAKRLREQLQISEVRVLEGGWEAWKRGAK